MIPPNSEIVLSKIAELADVRRAAVSNWRRRSSTFPEPRTESGKELFRTADVANWLDQREIPRGALREKESAGHTYGERFRANLSSADPEPPGELAAASTQDQPTERSHPALPDIEQLWTSLDRLRGSADSERFSELVLCLLYIQARDSPGWRELVAAARTGPAATWNVLDGHAGEHVPEMNGLLETTGGRDLGIAVDNVVRMLDDAAEQVRKGAGQDASREMFTAALEYSAIAPRGRSEFHTPKSIVDLMVALLEPRSTDRIQDPHCGSGELLTAAAEFIRKREAPRREAALHGTAPNQAMSKIATLNLLVHGIEPDIRTATEPGLPESEGTDACTVVLCNPPFNLRSADTDRGGSSWRYGRPPEHNSNFAWLQRAEAQLAADGRAAVVMPNNAASATGREAAIRGAMVEAGVVRAIIALPPNLFRNTRIPVSVWLLTAATGSAPDELLLIDATQLGRPAGPNSRSLTEADAERIARSYRAFRDNNRVELPEFCSTVPIEQIREREYLLNPPAYLTSPHAVLAQRSALEHARTLREELTSRREAADRASRRAERKTAEVVL